MLCRLPPRCSFSPAVARQRHAGEPLATAVRAPLAASRPTRTRRAAVVVRASQTPPPPLSSSNEAVKLADSVGLTGLEEGMFGFKPFSELWTGRLAMLGFATGVTVELVNGRPILQQLGIITPDSTIFWSLSAAIGGAMVFSTARTLSRLTSGDMTVGELRRYSFFFGLDVEKLAQKIAEKEREKDAARVPGSFAELVMNPDELVSAEAVAAAAGVEAATAAAAAAAAPAAPPKSAFEFEREYSRGVEIENGRWAMVGFALAILIEAGTGNGVVGQLEVYAKAVGLLGAESGF